MIWKQESKYQDPKIFHCFQLILSFNVAKNFCTSGWQCYVCYMAMIFFLILLSKIRDSELQHAVEMYVHKIGVVGPLQVLLSNSQKSASVTQSWILSEQLTPPQIQPLITSRQCSLLEEGTGVCDLGNLFSCSG